MKIHPMTTNPVLRPPLSGFGKTNFAACLGLAALGLLSFGAQAADNTGTGGTITYTDANGLNPVASPPYFGGFVVHKFTASGTLNVPASTSADVLVVGGGGGGGKFGAGGGAGGFLANSASITASTNYTVTVGAGGAGTGTAGALGASGSNSVFQSFTASGGGGGGSRTANSPANGVNGAAGGSGGGGSASDSGATAGGAGTAGQGNAGGAVVWTSSSYWGSGGGGGAGGVGGAGTRPGGSGTSAGGNGGVGLSSAMTGNTVFYAGGGGGGTYSASSGTVGAGGNGGGGAGTKVDAGTGTAGTANTGGGGGGGGVSGTGGSGGSGIVVVKYPYVSADLAVVVTAPSDNQSILFGTSITATATVVNGTSPYSVTFSLNTNGGGFTQVGSPVTTSPYQVNLGTPATGTYQIKATATDSVAGTATSATITFYVYKLGNSGTGGTITYTDANGLNPRALPPYPTGYVVHNFTASDSLNVPMSSSADFLVVGGGGGGGRFGAGGGAGGFLANTASITGGTTYSVTVGTGGAGTGTAGAVGASGGNSVFQSFTASGGGGGGSRTGNNPANGVNGAAGGSGGGGSASDSGTTTGGAGTSGQGNAGGSLTGTTWGSGGGGGAGAAGGNATGTGGTSTGGNGGVGLSSALTGSSTFYAGGGGGGSFSGASSGTAGTGGNGGGGAGTKVDAGIGTAGTANTGGGGGGGGLSGTGGSGGSGIVVVKYLYNPGDLGVAVTVPADNQSILLGSPITATATVVNGTSPYSVTFFLNTNGGGFTQVGSPDTTSPYQVNVGSLAAGTYQIKATVTDGASGTATSATNTFVVYDEGNSGTGGSLLYTDVNGQNPRQLPPYTNGYVVHKFTASDTLNLPASVTANVLVVAGGGGGGTNGGGGGGAGGLTYNNAFAVAAGSIPVTVGGGGAVHPNDASNPTTGGNSVFNTITTLGGGGGSSRDAGGQGASGGSGGGGGGATLPSRTVAGSGTAGQGFNGGNGVSPDQGVNSTGGGGGGAGGAGTVGTGGASPVAGNGGIGLSYPIFADIAGSPTGWFAGGGAGQKVFAGNNGTAGQGGGGAAGSAGVANTGGGGGGGGIGGSGIVLVRYPYAPTPPLSVTVTSPTDGQTFNAGPSITATATVLSGTSPYSVTFYLNTNGGGFTQVGSADTTSPYQANLGALGAGTYQIKATVTDSTSGTATSATNTFTVNPPDTTPPTITSVSPVDNGTRVSPLVNLVATFSENIASGTGNIVLKDLISSTQTLIAVTDSSQVTISGNQLTINPTGNYLSASRNYAVQIPSGAIMDVAFVPNSFAGINDDTTWDFTTSPFQVNNFTDGSDAATGISSAINYTHLVDIRKDADTAVISGVTFNNTGAYTLTGTSANYDTANPINGGNVGSGINVLLDHFQYGGAAPVLTVSGLIPGQTYKLRLYVSSWNGGLANFSFNDTSPATVITGVDRGAWQAAPSSFDYTYTQAVGATTLSVTIAGQGGNTFHWYGFSNEVIPTAPPPTAYQSWATGSETFNGDANGDGIANGMAWFLGAANPSVSAQSKMPTPTNAGGFLNLSFQRVYPYAPAKLYLQFGNGLTGWTELLIPDGSDSNLGGTGVQVTVVLGNASPNPDQVTVKIPTSYQSASGALFARLRAAEN